MSCQQNLIEHEDESHHQLRFQRSQLCHEGPDLLQTAPGGEGTLSDLTEVTSSSGIRVMSSPNDIISSEVHQSTEAVERLQ